MKSSSLTVLSEPTGSSGCSSGGCTPSVGAGVEVALNLSASPGTVDATAFTGRAAVVTLGCAKNQVDTEVMIGVLKNAGYEIVTDLALADVALVNTCGFLQSAVKESVSAILDVAEYKQKGRLRTLIVAGCAVERYRKELKQNLPEADVFVTLEDLLKVGDAAREGASAELDELLNRSGRPYFLYDDTMPRVLGSRAHMAYVKVSEGCDRPCTFCIIPKIRGAMRSRSVASVVREVSALGVQGVQEVNLVAQDLTSYGRDLKGPSLVDLLQALDAARAVPWVRLLYAYPIGVDERLLDAISTLPSVCKYLDIPLQHSSERVLKAMKRPVGRFSPRSIVEFIRARAPEVHIRTTFIVGFPGETDEDIADLQRFISEGHFSSVGIFTYSAEEGTPAAAMGDQISEKEKKKRRDLLMRAQQRVVSERLSALVGSVIPVLVEGSHEDTDLLLVGRAGFQAPEVDGSVIINDLEGSQGGLEDLSGCVGSIVNVRITEVAGYDIIGCVVPDGAERRESGDPLGAVVSSS